METDASFSQPLLLILISALVSSAFFASLATFFLSSGLFYFMGPIKNPAGESFIYGGSVGILHGLMTGLIIYWLKAGTMASSVISSVFAMEIVLLIAVTGFYLIKYFRQPRHLRLRDVNPRLQYIYATIYILSAWFLILSLIFLIPSVIVGITNGFALKSVMPNWL